LNQLGDSSQLSCVQVGAPANCYSTFLSNFATGHRDPPAYNCRPDYSPDFTQLYPDSISHLMSGPAGMFPLDAADIASAKVVIRNYRPVDHFTRTVETSEKPLSEWLAK
jgi:hypothetical protein